MLDCIRLPHEQMRVIIQHCQSQFPEEACGLLAGIGDEVLDVIPMQNVAPDPKTRYNMEPNALLRSLKQLDANQLELLGYYHSHPGTDAIPSNTDIREARIHTPESVHLIISLKDTYIRAQAWRIQRDGGVVPVELLRGSERSTQQPGLRKEQQAALILATAIAVLLLIGIAVSLLPPAPSLPIQ